MIDINLINLYYKNKNYKLSNIKNKNIAIDLFDKM